MGQKRSQSLRSQLLADNDAGGTSARKVLVAVLVRLAACKGNNLSRHIGAQLLLAGSVLNHHIRTDLIVLKSDELERNNGGSLVEQLIERVLSVGSRLTEDHWTGLITHSLAEAVHAFAVGLHVQLL